MGQNVSILIADFLSLSSVLLLAQAHCLNSSQETLLLFSKPGAELCLEFLSANATGAVQPVKLPGRPTSPVKPTRRERLKSVLYPRLKNAKYLKL